MAFNLNLSTKAEATLRALADDCDLSKTATIRRAIALLDFAREQEAEGLRLVVVDKVGRIKKELVLL